MWATVSAPKILGISMERELKSAPPAIREAIGIMMSSTRDLTIVVKAPPTATPMARSTTLPRLMNSANSRKKAKSIRVLIGLFSAIFVRILAFEVEGFGGLVVFLVIICLL